MHAAAGRLRAGQHCPSAQAARRAPLSTRLLQHPRTPPASYAADSSNGVAAATSDLFAVIGAVGRAKDARPTLAGTAGGSGSSSSSSSSSNGSGIESSSKGVVQKLKEWIGGSKLEKEKILALGMGGFASYGVISNVNYGSALAISWLGFVKATGTSPLAPGQWKPFLAFYAGMWAVQNFVRPLRFALAVALAPTFEKIIATISKKTGAPKGVAFGLLLGCIAILTCSLLFGVLYFGGGLPPVPAA